MGQSQSSCRLRVARKFPCFPLLAGESELLLLCASTVTALGQMHANYALFGRASFAFSAITLISSLIQFSLSKLSGNKADPKGQGTLETSLLLLKIDRALVSAAVQGLKAKLTALNNRYERLLGDVKEEEKKLEIVPAMVICEEVLELFRDPEGLFRRNPLVSAPFLVTFAGVYVTAAELTTQFIPSYRGFLMKQMVELQETLQGYKEGCVMERERAGKISGAGEQSLLELTAEGGECPDLVIRDKWQEFGRTETPQQDLLEIPVQSKEEAMILYRKVLEEKYGNFFDWVINHVEKFLARLMTRGQSETEKKDLGQSETHSVRSSSSKGSLRSSRSRASSVSSTQTLTQDNVNVHLQGRKIRCRSLADHMDPYQEEDGDGEESETGSIRTIRCRKINVLNQCLQYRD